MLWASDAQGRDGKPAVLLLSTQRRGGALLAEVAYVAADLPEGPLPGRFWRSPGAALQRMVLAWPAGWPPSAKHRLHPRVDTPDAALAEVDGDRRVRLEIVHRPEGEPI